MVLVPRSGGAAAFVKRGGGVPGRPTDYFFFLAGLYLSCRLGEGRGAGCLTRAGGDRWPKTTTPRAGGAWRTSMAQRGGAPRSQFSSVSYMR